MARSNSNSALKFVGAAAAAIVGGVAIGYLFGGGRASQTTQPIIQQPTAPVSTPAAPVAPPAIHPRATNGNYTAPGAPRIVIHEESDPVLRRADRTVPTPPADTEASQEAPPVKTTPPSQSSDNSSASSSDSNTTGAPSGADISTPASGTDTSPTPPDTSTPPPPPAPADPDFEHVVKPSDSESGQAGGGKAQFRVQTGTYTDESHARSIADQLRSQGYTTSTRSERDGDHLIYKVQAGAYRSKNGANKAASDLQKKGFPAYVSPITP
ncbi:MAG: SPOR domain-containing protein [Armatimonadota bacterium]|nr:SPOR domain-containing protein [Armatimonadota bacterium]